MAVAMVAAAVAGGQPDKYPCSLGVYLYPYSLSDPHIRIRPVPFGGHIRNIRVVSDINGYPPAENAWWAQTKSAGGHVHSILRPFIRSSLTFCFYGPSPPTKRTHSPRWLLKQAPTRAPEPALTAPLW